MALDGAFLRFLKRELNENLKDSRIDKIHQPNSEEFIFSLRNKSGVEKLLISARANSPRVHITKHSLENPQAPPMLCMLFRKKLVGAKFVGVRQEQTERILFFDFDAKNDLGDVSRLVLAVEIMGKYSNVILMDAEKNIVDSLKRVGVEMSSKRQVLPGMKYALPPAQGKLCLLSDSIDEAVKRVFEFDEKEKLFMAILGTVQGVSPIICKETAYKTTKKINTKIGETACDEKATLTRELTALRDKLKAGNSTPCMIRKAGAPMDFSFEEITCIDKGENAEKYESFSALLDDFYYEKDTAARMKSKAQSLNKMLVNAGLRLERKIEAQKNDIENCKGKENYKVLGDLINSNLHRISKGADYAEVEDFYSDDMRKIKIRLDPSKSGAQNAQKYYKEYRKAKTAQGVLEFEIQKADSEKKYIDAVVDCMSRAKTEQELLEIREELEKEGYIKEKRGKKVKAKESVPLRFTASDGTPILVGKNNRQNDKLTLKTAKKTDIWLHVKDLPGSHVIVMCGKENVSDQTLKEAAMLAAFHSKARESSGVAVDYTEVQNVKKPSGAKPGMVIYNSNKTLYVTPDEYLKNKLATGTNDS